MRALLLVLALASSSYAMLVAAEPGPVEKAKTSEPASATPAKAETKLTLAPIHPSIFAPKTPRMPPRDAAPRTRAISPEMAGRLGSLVKEAVAALPAPPPKSTEEHNEESADTVRMDPFIVEDERPPDLKERHILTKKGTEALMQKQYPALQKLGPIPLFNGIKEREIREDDLRKERRKEMQELTGKAMPLPPSDHRPQNGTPFKESQTHNRF